MFGKHIIKTYVCVCVKVCVCVCVGVCVIYLIEIRRGFIQHVYPWPPVAIQAISGDI